MPEPLTPRERIVFWIVAAGVALTRLYALSRSLWDWDEALFATAVRSYDVAVYHPHPPGFPLFILAAKLAHVVVADEFRAVQVVTLAGAIFLFPAFFALARELGFPFVVAAGGGLIYAFFPTVWVYGGTAFSDIPASTLVLFACALLLRGCHDRRAYLAGAAVLAISVGFRSQNLLIGCAPALFATWCSVRDRAWRSVAAAIAIGAAVVGVSYAGAAYASSNPPHGYLSAISNLRTYVREVDSFLSPNRESLRTLLPSYFLHPMRSGRFDFVVVAFAVLGLAMSIRRFGTLMLLAMFVPFQIFSWLMLDPHSVSRYGTAFLPLYALLAAIGACVIPSVSIGAAIIVLIAGRLATWTGPSIRDLRSSESPTAAAMGTILRSNRGATVFAHGSMAPFCDYYLSSRHVVMRDDESKLPMSVADAEAPYVAEGMTASTETKKFWRSRDRLWTIVRDRYFEVSITPMRELWRFVEGWYEQEGEGVEVVRWMGSHSKTILPPIGPRARLRLEFAVPSEIVPSGPLVSLQLNGKIIAKVRCTSEVTTASWDVDARSDSGNELVLSTDRVVNPLRDHLGNDARDLGIELRSYEWTPIR